MTTWTNPPSHDTEHECPRPLETRVDEFTSGGMFLSPAGRWETITDRTPFDIYTATVVVHTDRTGLDYCWQFWRSAKFPYLPAWHTTQPRQVVVFETLSMLAVEVTSGRSFGHGHTLCTARPVRGAGWELTDHPDGTTIEQITLPNKARARAELTRRARAHARRLGLIVRPAGGDR